MTKKYEGLDIIIPVCNEEDTIEEVVSQLQDCFDGATLHLVNNRSHDHCVDLLEKIAKQDNVLLHHANDRQGKGFAMRVGVEQSKNEYVLFHDSDLEYVVSDAIEVVNELMSGKDMVIGYRVIPLDVVTLSTFLAQHATRQFIRWRYGVDIRDPLTGTRALRRKCIENMNLKADGFAVETEISVKAIRADCVLGGSPVRYSQRDKKQGKKIRPADIVPILLTALGVINNGDARLAYQETSLS